MFFSNFYQLRSGKTCGSISVGGLERVSPLFISEIDAKCLQVFNGECSYETWDGDDITNILRVLLRSRDGVSAAFQLVRTRGWQHMLLFSDLEKFQQSFF